MIPPRPHDVAPSIDSARIVLAIKNFAKVPGVCHIGLGVTAANTLKVLRRAGFHAEAWPCDSPNGRGNEIKVLRAKLEATAKTGGRPVTHVIISAPSWIQPVDFSSLAFDYPDTTFVQLNHSGAAYLSIDKYGIRNIRDVAALSQTVHNIRVAANNERVARFVATSFGVDCLYLPNLYDTESYVPFVPKKIGSTIRIGSFGASRPWKNQLCAAEASVMIGKALGCDVELYVNSKRPDGGERMIESRQELFHQLPGCKIVDVPWASWPHFRDITASMNLLVQPSFDETFNVCTADGIAEGVPSVTTSALEWTPESWWARAEDPHSIMRVGVGLLHSSGHAVEEGRTNLKKYVSTALHRWSDYVLGKSQMAY